MTYNVLMGTLNPTRSLTPRHRHVRPADQTRQHGGQSKVETAHKLWELLPVTVWRGHTRAGHMQTLKHTYYKHTTRPGFEPQSCRCPSNKML